MLLLYYLVFSFLVVRLALTIYNSGVFRILESGQSDDFPQISILVSLYNEESRVIELLEQLVRLDYPAYDVLLLDCGSTDRTRELAVRFCAGQENFRLMDSAPSPKGWGMTSWARHQLGFLATGKYLFYISPDVCLHTKALQDVIAQYHSESLDGLWLLTAPKHPLQSAAFHYALLTTLPVKYAYRLGGHALMLEAETYQKAKWHQHLPEGKSEPVALAQHMREADKRIGLISGGHLVMLHTDLKQFGQLLQTVFKHKYDWIAGFLLLTGYVYLCLLPQLHWALWMLLGSMLMLLRFFVCLAIGQYGWIQWLTQPVQWCYIHLAIVIGYLKNEGKTGK